MVEDLDPSGNGLEEASCPFSSYWFSRLPIQDEACYPAKLSIPQWAIPQKTWEWNNFLLHCIISVGYIGYNKAIVPFRVHYALSSEDQLTLCSAYLSPFSQVSLTWSSRLAFEFFCRLMLPVTWLFPLATERHGGLDVDLDWRLSTAMEWWLEWAETVIFARQ